MWRVDCGISRTLYRRLEFHKVASHLMRGPHVDGELHELTPIERHRPCMDAA